MFCNCEVANGGALGAVTIQSRIPRIRSFTSSFLFALGAFSRALSASTLCGGHSSLEPRLPIPNRTVKRVCADDSVHSACESRLPPRHTPNENPGLERAPGFFVSCCAETAKRCACARSRRRRCCAPRLPPRSDPSSARSGRASGRGIRPGSCTGTGAPSSRRRSCA